MDQTTTPPTEPGDLQLVVEPPKWPTPVGILSIVFGSLSLICGGLGSLFMFFGMDLMWQMMPSEGPPPPPMPIDPFLFAVTLISLMFQILLIAAGIATVKRSATGRPLHLVYAVGYLIAAAVQTYATWDWQADYARSPEVAQWKAENAASPMVNSVGQEPTLVSFVPGAAISAAWPVFCLFWFGPRGRSERALRIDEEDRLV